MNRIRQLNLKWVIAFIAMLPVAILGQQSILLQPDEQVPVMPFKLPIKDSKIPVESNTANLPWPSVATVAPKPPALVSNSGKNVLTAIQSSPTSIGVNLNLIVKGANFQFETKNLQNPSRLVIDLLGVASSKWFKSVKPFQLGNIRVGKHVDKTRVVVDFFSPVIPNYQVVQNNMGLQVNFAAVFPKYSSALISVVSKDSTALSQLPVVIAKKQILKSPSPLSRKLISIDFRDADIRNVLRFMAKASDRNIVFGNDVVGQVSIQLKQVPWQDALHAVLQVAKLGYTQTGGIIRVFSAGAFAKERGFKCQVVCGQDS